MRQRLAGHIIHHQIPVAILAKIVIEGRNGAMVQTRKKEGLAQKAVCMLTPTAGKITDSKLILLSRVLHGEASIQFALYTLRQRLVGANTFHRQWHIQCAMRNQVDATHAAAPDDLPERVFTSTQR